jgi:hypothetical protein
MSQAAPNHRSESYPQPSHQKTLRKLFVINNINNNNQNAQRFEVELFFESDLLEKALLAQADLIYLRSMLAYHPFGQHVADELAGQLRARGRGLGGVRSPRGLAKTLANAAITGGVDGWVYESQEAALRASRLLAKQREATWVANRHKDKQEDAARLAAGPSPALLAAREYRRTLPGAVKK